VPEEATGLDGSCVEPATSDAPPDNRLTSAIDGCGQWFTGPWYLKWHTKAEHPGWTATYELLRPYPNQRIRVVYRQVQAPPTT
jgi:hypothetical protein